MKRRAESLAVTLHWIAGSAEHSAIIVCEDGTPAHLIPLLLAGCGLPGADHGGHGPHYALHLGAPTGQRLRDGELASQQGLRSGDHLWLLEQGQAPGLRCAIALPDDSELLLAPTGATITRPWLLQALALLNPAAHRRELELLERRASAFRYVSSRPHCAIAPDGRGGWSLSSDRADVTTQLNAAPLAPGAPTALQSGDRITLGDAGPTLRVSLLAIAYRP